MRNISEIFLSDLKEGVLSPFLRMVKFDTSLCLELRGNSVNVYYRGGNLMKVKVSRPVGTYSVSFNPKYFKYGNEVRLPSSDVANIFDTNKWLAMAPTLKQAMDQHLSRAKKVEREYQQIMLRDNNFGSIARSTDYYICDIEYQSRQGRFDMIAVHWPSKSKVRRYHPHNRQLVFVEVKHGDGALDGKSGLHDHVRDINKYAGDRNDLKGIKEDMVRVFNQKLELGLIDCGKPLVSFSDAPPILMLTFVNHDPEKSKLGELLQTLPESPNIELRIATASFFGYGLYDQGVHSLVEVWSRFGNYIHHQESPSA